jgi:NtrC-family two-component system sensor histidine kinase KinB
MTVVAAYLAIGPVPAVWALLGGTVTFGAVRGSRLAGRLTLQPVPDGLRLLSLSAANVTMHSASMLAGGAVFQALGGAVPLRDVSLSGLLPLGAFGLTFLGVNYLVAGLYIAMRGRAALRQYLGALRTLVLYEGGPLVFAPLMTLIYTRLGAGLFILYTVAIVTVSLTARSLALTSRRLERRVQELSTLHAVGQTLSASLDLNVVLSAIHSQVAALLPADNFYVALYNAETEEVSFPLAIEDGRRVHWRSRDAGTGLTEHVLWTRTPLLIPTDIPAKVKELGIEQIGRPAACWLGVPILAGDETLGVIAVQSHSTPGAYDTSHQEMLLTLAAHAAMAIQNARLYARTDTALAHRVQELNSILRTTQEGIMLFGRDRRVLAANRALARFLGVAQVELSGRALDAPWQVGQETLLSLLGYSPPQLQADCEELAADVTAVKRGEIVVPGPPERYVERTLTPVLDREGQITAWLLVLRDLTEERELAHLRDELTHMLIHDLRSPLSVVQGGLDMIDMYLSQGDMENVQRAMGLAKSSSVRMIRMIGDLLDVSKLESGKMQLKVEAVDTAALLREVAGRFDLLAASSGITLETAVPEGLPQLQVDPELMGRVVHNLVDNAIKFTPAGGRVRLWARFDPERTVDTLLIGVTDNGPGVPPEELPLLFQKFQQATSGRGRRSGTGLGLPFCRLAVEAHGGRIWVDSEVGRGTTFTVALPVAGRQPEKQGA